ncbi:MAG: hypothetical protein ACR2KL_09880 [Nocardioidaceae bacterium]
MSTGSVKAGGSRRPAEPARGLLPDAAPRVGAHVYAGKRVRDDVREGLAVMAFSMSVATVLACLLTVLAHAAG